MASNAFAALVLLGPGPDEHQRLVDLLDSLFYYEPDVRAVLVIDDSVGFGIVNSKYERVVIIRNSKSRYSFEMLGPTFC